MICRIVFFFQHGQLANEFSVLLSIRKAAAKHSLESNHSSEKVKLMRLVKPILPNTVQSASDTLLQKMYLWQTVGRIFPTAAAGERKDILQAARESQLFILDIIGRLTRAIIVSDLCFSSSATYLCSFFYSRTSQSCLLLFSDISELWPSDSIWGKLVSFLIHFPDRKE